MAIGYDTQSSVQGGGVSQLTIPTFATAGEKRLCFVGAGMSGGTVRTTSTVIRGGSESFTEIWDNNNGGSFQCSGHYFVSPNTGTATTVVTWSGSCDECCAGAISLTGVNLTTPIGSYGVADDDGVSNGNPSVTVTAADDEWLVDMVYCWPVSSPQTITAGADQTSRWEQESIQSFTAGGTSTQLGSISGDIMSWTANGNCNNWIIGAVPIKPDPGLPPPQDDWFVRKRTRQAHSATDYFVAKSWFAPTLADVKGWFDPDLIPLAAYSTWTYVGSGGMTFGGSAGLIKEKVPAISGGLTFSGSAELLKIKIFSPSGGIVFAGAGTTEYIPGGGTIWEYTGSGGLTLAGAALLEKLKIFTPSGGLTLAGSANYNKEKVFSPSGGLTFAGTGDYNKLKVYLPSGGLTLGGQASLLKIKDYLGGGNGPVFAGGGLYNFEGIVSIAALYEFIGRQGYVPKGYGGTGYTRSVPEEQLFAMLVAIGNAFLYTESIGAPTWLERNVTSRLKNWWRRA